MDITFRRNCKAVFLIFVLLLFISVLYGCDPFAGKRPTDYKNSKWVCQDPDIMITVSEKNEIYWELNGAAIDYELILGMGRNFWIHDNKTGQNLLEGKSSYSAEEMSVVVSTDLLFDGAYKGKKIVFRRVE